MSDERDLLEEAIDVIHEVAAKNSTLPMEEFRRTGAYKCMVDLVVALRMRDAAQRERLSPPLAPVLECPTNHEIFDGEPWALMRYSRPITFCPDCGISLASSIQRLLDAQ